MENAFIDEIFASVQGEGPWVGERHIFVRFIGCDLRCKYCDTPAARGKEQGFCRAQKSGHAFEREPVPNPVASAELMRLCSRLIVSGESRPVVSLTGGEPLLQKAFLLEWLPEAGKRYKIYLETCGIHHQAMKELREQVDVVSMDFKLPTATGLRSYWDEHREFFKAALGRGLFVKAVVTGDTAVEDVTAAAKLIAGIDRSVLLVIQPASGPMAPRPEKLLKLQEAALRIIDDVRVIPQLHRMLDLP